MLTIKINQWIKASLLFVLLTPVSFVFAQDQSCDVPVCDIQAQMLQLRNADHNARGMFGINLMEKYKDSQDVNILNNLYRVGKQLKSLNEELGDEGWVKRAATDLINAVVLGLAKYSQVNADQFTSFYKQLEDQNARFAMVSHWTSELENIENVKTFEALIVFADNASEVSVALGDDDWVARAANELVSEATIKLIALDPTHEGLYAVRVSETSLNNGAFSFDRVAVLDSSSEDNLVVVFINTKLRHTVYSYSHTTIKGNTVKGTFLSNADLANSFSFELDRSTGGIQGSITTTSEVVEFKGEQIYSTNEVFRGESPLELEYDDILGQMQGKMAGISGTLSVRSFRPGIYSASFISDSGSIVLHFQGKFFPQNGVLSLTYGNEVKLTLALREVNGEIAWYGSSFSTTTATVSAAKFSFNQ